MAKLWESWLACDGECGTKITITSVRRTDTHDGALNGIAELLGWKTVDAKKGRRRKTLVFCASCQKRARLIVEGQ